MDAFDTLLSEDFNYLRPVSFFQLTGHVRYCDPKNKGALSAKYRLPRTEFLCGEDGWADVAIGWNEQGLRVQLETSCAFEHAVYPRIQDGDSLELFIDTRDIKNSGFNHRFCHHFFLLPKKVDGHQAGEITRFRTEDAHELCDGKALVVEQLGKRKWQLFIPNHCLFGYDPDQFQRLGFSYRLNRRGGATQHFTASSQELAVEQQPALWSSQRLVQ